MLFIYYFLCAKHFWRALESTFPLTSQANHITTAERLKSFMSDTRISSAPNLLTSEYDTSSAVVLPDCGQ